MIDKPDFQEQADARRKIMNHITGVRRLLTVAIGELYQRSNDHDQTKFNPEEFPGFARHMAAMGQVEYGSDEHARVMALAADSISHHYLHNRHHPQHFPDGIDGMTLVDLLEMVCDWMIAAQGYNKNGDFKRSLAHNTERFRISDQLVKILQNTARWIDAESAEMSDREGPPVPGVSRYGQRTAKG